MCQTWIRTGQTLGLPGRYRRGHSKHARAQGYSVVREIGGHGIGLAFHEDPWVSYVTHKGTGPLLIPGMAFTIEPMINMGRPGFYIDDANGWTVYTADHKPSAQWEITVLVTEDGSEVWPGNRSATCIQGLKFYKKFLTLYILCHIIEAVDLGLYIL